MSTGGSGSALNNVIQQEANAQSKGSVAPSFESKVVISSKGGSYDVGCPSGSPSSCKFGYYRTAAGRLTLPYKSGASFIFRSFVFGLFVNDLPIPCNDHPPGQPAACGKLTAADSSSSNTFPELARPAIRDALKSW
jgi:hypothetical protein